MESLRNAKVKDWTSHQAAEIDMFPEDDTSRSQGNSAPFLLALVPGSL